MLVLSRKVQEEIVVAGNIRITICAIKGDRVRVGITAPDDVAITRPDQKKGPPQNDTTAGPDQE